jgi:predicted transcriptional regulator of viral defense system
MVQIVGTYKYMPTYCNNRIHMMNSENENKIIQIVKKTGILRPRNLDEYKIHRKYLRLMVEKGKLVHVARGLYVLPDSLPTENRTIATVCKKIPEGVVCLLSALQIHGITTQIPFEVWIAIERKSRLPRKSQLPIRIVRFSGKALEEGIEEHNIEGVPVKIYCPAKTVVDCFKYRNKIGLDVAIEALKDCRRQRLCTNDDFWRYAKICRVTNIMKPYLEVVE